MLASPHQALGVVLALAIQPECAAEPLDVHDMEADGAVSGVGETMDVWFTSDTDEGGDSSESGEESGGGSGGEDPWVPPEEPDNSCLENLPTPKSQDNVWIAAGQGGSILRSTDAVHWDPIEIGGMGGLFESASVGSTFVLHASQWDELFVSDDGGLTWDLLASGLPEGLHDVDGVGDLFLARDQAGAISYWSEDGRIWHEAEGVAPTPLYAVGPAGILSGPWPDSSVTLSVDGKVWSEPLQTMGWWGDDPHLAGRGDQYLAWPDEFPPSRIHSSVDGLTWTTSDIAVGIPPEPWEWWAYTNEVRWNGAQYVLLGASGDAAFHGPMLARSCNGRVWGDIYTVCYSDDWSSCHLDFASTAAMTVTVTSSFDYTWMDWNSFSQIRYSADLVTWNSAGLWEHPTLFTVVVGDP
jgi:hypothetical protein